MARQSRIFRANLLKVGAHEIRRPDSASAAIRSLGMRRYNALPSLAWQDLQGLPPFLLGQPLFNHIKKTSFNFGQCLPMNENLNRSPFLQALARKPVARTPIWLMRQAGRYLPEYNRVRQEAGNFLNLCKTPSLACEVTLQPIRRFGFDTAILFSDILTIPDAMNLGLRFREGEGPHFDHPLSEESRIINLCPPDLEKLQYVFEAVTLIRQQLPAQTPLIGFAGSPFTLACYMIEGHGSKDFAKAKRLMFARPDLFQKILEVLVQAVSEYLIAQIRAGADAVQLFDTWGGLLSDDDYRQFSLAPMQKIAQSIRAACPHTPIIFFTKGGGLWLESMASSADGLGIDWTVDIESAFMRLGQRVALQGNLDPLALLAPPDSFLPIVANILEKVQRARRHWQKSGINIGHIFNLGHGITPQVPPDHVSALVEAVHQFPIANER